MVSAVEPTNEVGTNQVQSFKGSYKITKTLAAPATSPAQTMMKIDNNNDEK